MHKKITFLSRIKLLPPDFLFSIFNELWSSFKDTVIKWLRMQEHAFYFSMGQRLPNASACLIHLQKYYFTISNVHPFSSENSTKLIQHFFSWSSLLIHTHICKQVTYLGLFNIINIQFCTNTSYSFFRLSHRLRLWMSPYMFTCVSYWRHCTLLNLEKHLFKQESHSALLCIICFLWSIFIKPTLNNYLPCIAFSIFIYPNHLNLPSLFTIIY